MAAISESEAGEVWKALREARVRSLYFGDMQARYGKCKQWVQGLSLVLSSGAVVSGAVVSMVGDLWSGVAPVLAGVVAIVNAIAIATSLDQKLVTLATLRTAWESLRIDLSHLWSHWYEDGAGERFDALQQRANDLGSMASFGAPWDRSAVARWERWVDAELGGEG